MAIEISTTKAPDLHALLDLFNEAGWIDKIDEARARAMVQNSSLVVTAWDGVQMVGFARCLTDHTYNGQINNVVVRSSHRGQEIGTRLVRQILQTDDQVTYILRADPGNQAFYEKLGFEPADLAVVYKRKR
jgi:ribosomal protein S18 acetylase RimI-like enzyme